jgi:hypothetical protein
MQFLRPESGALLAAISLGEDFDEVFLSASGVILFGVW